jgi:NADPH-dependent curcumin reductase CurA
MSYRQVVLHKYPEGAPKPEDFAVVDAGPPPPLGEGDVRVEIQWLSMDPLPLVRMAERSPMGPSMRLGAFVEGRGGGRIIESRDDRFARGDFVVGEVGWREVATLSAASLTRVDPALGGLDLHLGILGASGLTGYFLAELASARAGQTVLVAPAAGSVGMVATQLLAREGAKVVGIVGGEHQSEFVRGLGAVRTVDHRTDQLHAALNDVLAEGWDAFLDGVGGLTHEAALPLMNVHARLVLFGFISGYGNEAPPSYGNAAPILLKRATAFGFLLSDFVDRHEEARRHLARKLEEGSLASHNHITHGLDQTPSAFSALFGDAAPGKQLIKI